MTARRGTKSHDLLLLLRLVAITVALLAVIAGTARADFGVLPGSFEASVSDTRAGAHADAVTDFQRISVDKNGVLDPVGTLKDVVIDAPPGLVGNVTSFPTCSTGRMLAYFAVPSKWCNRRSMVGVIDLTLGGGVGLKPLPIFSVDPPPGVPASFAFVVVNTTVVRLDARIRSDGEYALTVVSRDLSIQLSVLRSRVTLWGVPADHQGPGPLRLDSGDVWFPDGPSYGSPSGAPRRPFITNPTECNRPGITKLALFSWEAPTVASVAESGPTTLHGCADVPFSPSAVVKPTATGVGSATGLDASFGFPQSDDPDGIATAHLKDTTVTLPDGLTLNPSTAAGLEACSDAQMGLQAAGAPPRFDTEDPLDGEGAECPSGSVIGSVTATTPVLAQAITGDVVLGTPRSTDPQSGEMFRLFLVLRIPERGILVKLYGSAVADPVTGQLTATFANNPQFPVGSLTVSLKGGSRGALAQPQSCGDRATTATLVPWTAANGGGGAARSLVSSYTVDGSCAPAFAPALTSGMSNPMAGGTGTFSFALARADNDQWFSGLNATLPAGLLASIKGTPRCSSADAANGTCPAGSRIGTVDAAAGAGTPFVLEKKGTAYLTEGYRGCPYGLEVTVPVEAGPFTGALALGNIVVRQAVCVDPIDAHVTVLSDPLPTIWHGIPLRVRSLTVLVDRDTFMLNPTSCAGKSIRADVTSAIGSTVSPSVGYRASGCGGLDLKPDLALSLSGKGQTTDNKHPAVTAVVTQKPGQANLKKVRVALPLSVALDPDNANGLCEFADGSKTVPTCPKASIVGTATATTPILDEPLSGPVYFVKNIRKDPKSGREIRTLPKLVVPLVGQNGLRLTLTGTSNVDHDQLVTTFDNIPDAPVSSFKMSIIGGKGGILVVSGTDICKSTQVADQQIDGQNNKSADADVYIQTPSCPLKVITKKVGKSSVAVKVGGLGAGKITVTGKGIRKTTKTIAKSTVATITAKRSKGKPGKVTVSFDPTGPAKAHKTSK